MDEERRHQRPVAQTSSILTTLAARTIVVRVIGVALAAVLVAAAPGSAHHSISATYDIDRVVTLTGTVARVEWQSPHVVLYVDVGADAPVRWRIETLNPQGLKRVGVDQASIKVADRLQLQVCTARDGARSAVTQTMTLPSGRTIAVSVGSAELRALGRP